MLDWRRHLSDVGPKVIDFFKVEGNERGSSIFPAVLMKALILLCLRVIAIYNCLRLRRIVESRQANVRA